MYTRSTETLNCLNPSNHLMMVVEGQPDLVTGVIENSIEAVDLIQYLGVTNLNPNRNSPVHYDLFCFPDSGVGFVSGDCSCMSQIYVRLFGHLSIYRDEQQPVDLEARKPLELFCFLLIHRTRPYPREILANLLWGDFTTSQSKKYLRQALWKLKSGLENQFSSETPPVLLQGPEWVQYNQDAPVWCDISQFEATYDRTQEIAAHDLDGNCLQAIQSAVDLYRGDLLEGWYPDWCLYERERLQDMYLIMLDKLMGACKQQRHFETGIDYGQRILKVEPARERTHRQLMLFYTLLGDRTAALRQYETCREVLQTELGVLPSNRTDALYQQIASDQIPSTNGRENYHAPAGTSPASMEQVLWRLYRMHAALNIMQRQVSENIQLIEGYTRHLPPKKFD